MSLLPLTPAFTLNLLALLAACPGIGLLYVTRNREQRELRHLAVLSALSQIDEPMHLMDVSLLRMNRLCYRVGAACLGFALLLSWVSTGL
ncbi:MULTISPECIES: hypothetical protein [Pseudomonas]|jgi:hypothetical protein|uniref:Uncharacterized protein n=1 Tax=Pseudomonas syringae TaxID=317 RepID=A0A085V710_PSESX|nr:MULTISPECIES: hypothetical protein [Pseudomonas]EPJ86830.1 hypothetical protein CFII64_09036 [Pseudomonas sp. CFII64]KFE51223.1 hypothetical protein IV02_13515 [Pseudomonas syringae]